MVAALLALVGATAMGGVSAPSQPRAAAASTAAAPAATTAAATRLSAVWANEGGDKVWQEEMRATTGQRVANSVWDGAKIHIVGARNEVVSFVVQLESKQGAQHVSMKFAELRGPGKARIASSVTATGDQLWRYVGRNIEGFYLRYLKITGINRTNFGYDAYYDERHVPSPMRRPLQSPGSRYANGGWKDRPMADKSVPDIAVPIELVSRFDVAANRTQGIWYDVYIPRDATPGDYTGTVSVFEDGVATRSLPVILHVYSFALPDQPAAKTMAFAGLTEILNRYTGVPYSGNGDPRTALATKALENHFRLFKRHKISLTAENCDTIDICPKFAPAAYMRKKLSGEFYSAANGYDGPGRDTPDNVFVIGAYGSWSRDGIDSRAKMQQYMDAWESWFQKNAPAVERFIYVADESNDYKQLNQWLDWMKEGNNTVGRSLRGLLTIPLEVAVNKTPRVDIVASNYACSEPIGYANAYRKMITESHKALWHYNGKRPASGSFVTEDDGVATRMMPWAAYKMGISRWFYWATTYYSDFQANHGNHTDVFNNAVTFGQDTASDAIFGRTGYNRSNGEGVLVYPGRDAHFPASSYGVDGPFASVRLKNWRRGVQDVDYIALAAKKDPATTRQIVQSMVPKVLGDTGVETLRDPSYVLTDISWPVDPAAWEAARARLAAIIEKP